MGDRANIMRTKRDEERAASAPNHPILEGGCVPATEKPAILLTEPRAAGMLASLADEFVIVQLEDEAALARERDRIRAIMFAGHNQVPVSLMDSLPNLSLMVSPSAGIEGVDLEAARARSITVTSGGDTHSADVASYAVGLTVAARHQIVLNDAHVRSGAWQAGWPPLRRSLGTDRVGIVGLGPIGRGVAEGLGALCREIGWWGPHPKDAPWLRHDSIAALARWCDILILCARSGADTAKLIDAPIIEAIGPDGLFVNIARGFMVDEDSLIDALKAGRLGGAALDVFVDEPADPARWADVPNVVLSPHVGGMTNESRDALNELVRFNLRTLITGERPRKIVVEGRI